ncbi:hypothetical protein ACFXP3_13715 [Streptomyces sp. NPDC059096]|uniref:hypothetical protein n=1 Tax=Streptomyces sp. NPDC059096 TaxID=3346727 RepID=UPI003681689F
MVKVVEVAPGFVGGLAQAWTSPCAAWACWAAARARTAGGALRAALMPALARSIASRSWHRAMAW